MNKEEQYTKVALDKISKLVFNMRQADSLNNSYQIQLSLRAMLNKADIIEVRSAWVKPIAYKNSSPREFRILIMDKDSGKELVDQTVLIIGKLDRYLEPKEVELKYQRFLDEALVNFKLTASEKSIITSYAHWVLIGSMSELKK